MPGPHAHLTSTELTSSPGATQIPDDARRPVGQLTTGQLDRYGNQLTRCLKALGTDAPICADVQRELATVRAEQNHRAALAVDA